ncbi:MAG: hypothetical protein K9M54_09610 [Kiritimatiellales bacterium]|nr:hypothetical protein [Kiritimatiellales bacterium]MCF7864284.1 hypothetical protein [Kiritimatiellales bacterium]
MTVELQSEQLEQALGLLGEYLEHEGSKRFQLVVCGGAALIAKSLVARVTADVDILALLDEQDRPLSPDPLPEEIIKGAAFVQRTMPELELPDDWLNNGPSRHPGGLFQTGLPAGLVERLSSRSYGEALTVWFLDRFDQIHLKLYAATDSGPGRHVDDLLKLEPTSPEIEIAAKWALTHDSSPGFRMMLVSMLSQLGYCDVAESI